MARKTIEEINALKKKFSVDRFWSWSRLNKYQISSFEYFLKYVLHKAEDRATSIYAPLGGIVHDILEKFYSGELKYAQMLESFEDYLFTLEFSDYKFNHNDEEKNRKIADKYIYDMKHFFKNHNPLKFKVALEEFVTAKIGNHVFMGYIDLVFKDGDGCFNIVDFKTSSMYTGDKVRENAGQLILYAIALTQMGVPLEKIKICWNFLKYCNIEIVQANGKKTTRKAKRSEIGSSLKSNCLMWLKKLGYGDEAQNYIDLLLETNDISCLPSEIYYKYRIDDCYVFVPLDNKTIQDICIEIIDTIADIEKKEREYKNTHDEKVFFDSEESVGKESFYFATLCGYSAKLHKPYGLYLDKMNAKKNGGIYGDTFEESVEDDSLAWLNDI